MNYQKLIFLVITSILFNLNLVAQTLLDVEGNAKITGKLELRRSTNSASVIIGENAGFRDTTTQTFGANVFIGKDAGFQNLEGGRNVYIGQLAGHSGAEVHNNTFIGYGAGRYHDEGTSNTYIGSAAGLSNDGSENTIIGSGAGGTGDGSLNTYLGSRAGQGSTSGFNNTFLGYFSGNANTTGKNNVFVGKHSGINSIKGIRNTLVGTGSRITASTDSLDRAIALGFEAQVGCHNCAVIGGIGGNAVKVGIDMTTPLWPIHIKTEKNALSGNNVDISELGLVIGRELNQNATATGIGFQSSTSRSTVGAAIIHERTGSASNGKLHFATKSSGVSNNDIPIRMTLNESGDLGIGITTPQEKLDVNGKARIRDVPSAVGTEDFVRIDANGNLFRSAGAAMLLSEDKNTATIIAEQNALIQAKGEEINTLKHALDEQKTTIDKLQSQLNDLQKMVEKQLVGQATTTKTLDYKLTLAQKAQLAQNQPNPFSETTLVKYTLPSHHDHAYLQITSMNGKELGKVKIEGNGNGQIRIKANAYPAGIYYYSLIADGQILETKRMILTN